MRRPLADYARAEGLRDPSACDLTDNIGRIQNLARSTAAASYAISEGVRIERADEPGRALSETGALSAIHLGIALEIVS